MNRSLLMLGMAAALAVVSCSTFSAADYDRGQTPPQQFANDAQVCSKLAESDQKRYGMGGDIDPTQATYNRMFDACMRASGYRKKAYRRER